MVINEVNVMPAKDGTGPEGRGPMTGRGMGPCASDPAFRSGFRRGFGRGFGLGRGFGRGRGFGFRRGYRYGSGYGSVRFVYDDDLPLVGTVSPENRIEFLRQDLNAMEDEKKLLEQDIQSIKKELKDMEKKK